MRDADEEMFGMDDEDFAKLNPSDVANQSSAPTGADDDVVTTKDDAGDEGNSQTDDDTAVDPPSSGSDTDPAADPAKADEDGKDEDGQDQDEDPADEEIDKLKPVAADKAKTKDDPKDPPKDTDKAAAKPVVDPADKTAAEPVKAGKDMSHDDLASFYDQVMSKPFVANGREIKLRSPDEAIRLMQMGAGFGKKLQSLQPALKSLRMLEKNNLLDESKLSYLIDLDKKNPEAIKKLIKDSGIDPLDLNMDDNPNYKPTNHSVSDTEVALSDTIKEVMDLPGGKETIQHIQKQWDKTSKDFLASNPSVLTAIQEQRVNGVYDAISAEIDRMKLMGDIAPNTPFLEAYKIAGDALVQANTRNQQSKPEAKPEVKSPTPPAQGAVDQTDPKILATRTAAPRSDVSNSARARAAATTRTSAAKAKDNINPLEMADDEFLKTFKL